MVEDSLEAAVLHSGCNVEQRASGGGHGDPGPGLDVGADEITTAVHGGLVRLRVPTKGHGDLDRPVTHALESPQRGRRQV
jgi:hypothetical protein